MHSKLRGTGVSPTLHSLATDAKLRRDTSFRTLNAMESLATIAHRRLYPSLADPNYLVLRSRRLKFATWANAFHGRTLTFLDIGGRYQPYRSLFEKYICHYYALDLVRTEFVNVVADAEALPFPPGTFDVVIATQVFDYLRDPVSAAKQVHAILKPGGVLLASFPACAPRFRDDELWRYTEPGLRSLLQPFATVEVVPELYSAAGVIRTLNLAGDMFSRYDFMRRAYGVTLCPLLNLTGLVLEAVKLTANDRFTPNYSVRAEKAR
jgi:SAM-dependent methyltransferase